MKLSKRENLFIANYISNNFNGYRAAIASGYSERSAHVIASRMLKKDKVSAAIQAHIDDVLHNQKQLLARTISELSAIAFIDYSDLLTANRLDISKVLKHGRAIKKLTFNSNGEIRDITLHDKMRSIEILMKYLDVTNEPEESDVTQMKLNDLLKQIADEMEKSG